MSILKEWRQTAARCPDVLMQHLIRLNADKLQVAIIDFQFDQTAATLATINGLWAKGVKLCEKATQVPEPTPPIAGAGKGEIEMQRIAA